MLWEIRPPHGAAAGGGISAELLVELLVEIVRGRLPYLGRLLGLLLIVAAVISVAAAAFVLTRGSVASRQTVSRAGAPAAPLTSTRRPPRHPRR
ncbi:MAG TPA: hypothetical protein VFP55_02860 [Solirubrobacteraceae bacterium]|nr:hypothetical protein [Solirubrobacteraceae bacterium]